jgi:uncharacterized membrane protein
MSDKTIARVSGALALGGGAIASYLTYTHYADETIACPTGGCATVQASSYALVAGVPVALIGLLGYLVILGALCLPRDLGRTLVLVAALTGSIFSTYLVAVQAFELDAFCAWCLASDAIIFALACLAALAVAKADDVPRRHSKSSGLAS